MDKKRLKDARKKIDQIDSKIFYLIKNRTQIVKYMLSLKKYKKQIVDRQRIGKVLNNIKKNSVKRSIDPKITKRIWSSMIKTYIEYEKRNFRK